MSQPSIHSWADREPTVNLAKAPLPTRRTLRMRRSLPFQFTRFLAFNVRILRMVLKGHH